MLYPYFLSLFFLYLNSSLTVHLSIYVSSVPIHQSLPLCVYTSLSLSCIPIFFSHIASIHLCIHTSVSPSLCMYLPLCVCCSLSLSYIPIFLSHIASIYLCIQCTYTSVSPSLCIYLPLSILYPYILVSHCIYPSMYPIHTPLFVHPSLSLLLTRTHRPMSYLCVNAFVCGHVVALTE